MCRTEVTLIREICHTLSFAVSFHSRSMKPVNQKAQLGGEMAAGREKEGGSNRPRASKLCFTVEKKEKSRNEGKETSGIGRLGE